MRGAIESHGGYVFKTQGDAFCAAFEMASDAVAAALAAQHALRAEAWEEPGELRVRMALHTGAVEQSGDDYIGTPLVRASRLLSTGHGGQVLLSQATCTVLAGALPEGASLRDLGTHRFKDLAQPEDVFQLLAPGLPTDFPALNSLDAHPNNLPHQLTSFIERGGEMEAVRALLAGTRLLTLAGAGGCGKTRLALQVAADRAEEYPHGVWLVELAALSDPELVAHTVAAALHLREAAGRTLTETLVSYLQPKQVLLILDNCEHLVAACATLCETLLRACPHLRILATSREPLAIPGEYLYRVPSLALPPFDPIAEPPLQELIQSEAVRLFVERATVNQPAFSVTPGNAPAVARVCHRLDGIPLAIELAAARVRVLTVEQIQARLDDRFRLLTGGSRTVLPRHQTLRAAMDWSYDLLTEAERALLRRLSVFAGGWTLEAAEAVCGGLLIADCRLMIEGTPGPSPISNQQSAISNPEDVFDLLAQLVDRSLVLAEERETEVRYRLLETIRQYGVEKLRGTAEAEEWRERHRDWFLALAEQAAPELTGPNQPEWLSRLAAEHDNLRAALDGAVERGEVEVALRLGGAVWRFWAARGYWSEGRERLARVLALGSSLPNPPAPVRARVLTGAGRLAWHQGDYAAARAIHEEGLAICREAGDREGIASALGSLAMVAHDEGEYTTARSLLEECLAVFRELGSKWHIATALHNLARVAQEQGDYRTAHTLYSESVAIARELGDTSGVAITLNNLGNVALALGDLAQARRLHEESLALKRELEDPWGIACSLDNLGMLAGDEGDLAAARALHEESLALKRKLGDRHGMASSLDSLGMLRRSERDLQEARRLHEESLAIRRELGERRGAAISLHNLGAVLQDQGDYRGAHALYAESIAIEQQLGRRSGIADSLDGFASLALTAGQPERAARLFGATQALRAALGVSLPPTDQAEFDRDIAAVREALGEAAFAAAWAAGQAMTPEEAVEYAVGVGTNGP